MLTLTDGFAIADVLPEQGGAIGRYDLLVDGAPQPVFDITPSEGRAGPFALGSNVLVPFSNRISSGGFRHDGKFHRLEPNIAGPYPIHGNGFSVPWVLVGSGPSHALMSLDSTGPGPFRYTARLTYRLKGGALGMALVTRNTGEASLPFGAGFHPWLVRTPEMRLTMDTAGHWTETADHLPESFVPTAAPFDFRRGAALPPGWINNAFTGWTGRAEVAWPDRGLALDIHASPPLTTVILYSPSSAARFLCFEPVSHSVDAHNRTDPGTAPPQVLAPGEVLEVEATFAPRRLR